MTRKPTELFDCDRVSSYLESYLLGQVPPPERRGMRLHIHGCPACFEKVMARDPLQIFAPLADEAPSDQFWEGFWPGVEEGIRGAQEARRPRRPWLRAAAILVTLSAAAAALILGPGRRQSARVDTTPQPPALSATATPSVTMPQTVEKVRAQGPDDVQIYTMTWNGANGAGTGVPPGTPVAELVLIVDKGLEL